MQICSLAHIYAAVPEGSARSDRKSQLSDLFGAVGGQLPPRPESGNRSPALLAALDKGRRAARLSSRYKAFGLIGAGLRNRFRPVFIPDGWGWGRFASFSRVSGYQLTRGVIVCVPLRTPCS